jgi:dipeptidyl aminopeptidase/acylaminoacyl peptidase
VLSLDGGEARRISELPEGVELFRWLPDSSGVVALAAAPRSAAERTWRRRRGDERDDPFVVEDEIPAWELWRIPLEGSPVRLLGGLRGLGDFDVSPDGKTLALETTHTGRAEDDLNSEIVLIELEGGDMRRAWATRRGQETRPRFAPDGALLFAGWADPACSFSRQELFRVELGGDEEEPRPLLAGIDRDMEHFAPLPGGRIVAAVAWGLESRVVLLEPSSERARVLPLEGVYLGGLASGPQASHVAAIVETPRALPELALISLEDGSWTPLARLNPEADSWQRAERRRVRWSHRGFEHEGLLVRPAAGAEPPPVLVWLHGGPHWRAVDRLRVYEAEAFAAAGWAVFVPQYRGSSGAGQDYSMAIRGDLGGAEAGDVLAGLDAIAAEGLVDGSRTAVAGASYGGYLANWLVATTRRFGAAVSIAGIFDLTQDYCSSDHFMWEEQYLGGPPWELVDLYRERSPLTRVRDIETPLLVLHGLDDDNTFFTNGQALYRSLRRLGKTTELVLYPREGHGVHEPRHRLDASQRVLAWIERHVRGREDVPLAGRAVHAGGLRLQLLSKAVREDYSGIAPKEERLFLELGFVLEALEHGPDSLRVVPCGSEADVVLSDPRGDVFRPVGVALEVHGQAALFDGRGFVEASRGPGGEPAALPVALVFELPERAEVYRLHVLDLPALRIEVSPSPDHEEDRG